MGGKPLLLQDNHLEKKKFFIYENLILHELEIDKKHRMTEIRWMVHDWRLFSLKTLFHKTLKDIICKFFFAFIQVTFRNICNINLVKLRRKMLLPM